MTFERVGLVVPADFAAWFESGEGEAGRIWVRGLPATVDRYCAQWGLTVDGSPMHGGLSVVLPVRMGSEPYVLKVAWLDESTLYEVAGLRAWNGRGTVRLILADEPAGVMLLERLDTDRSLADLPIGDAVTVAAGLVRRLAIPGPAGIPRLADLAERSAASFPEQWESLGRPLPRRTIDAAREAALELGPRAAGLLVNRDLHYENVLPGVREPWLAIDPKAIVGDPEYGIAQLLWTRLEDIEASGGLVHHFGALVEGADLDLAKARAWSLVHTVNYYLWALGAGLTEDPVKCARIAEWLLARTSR